VFKTAIALKACSPLAKEEIIQLFGGWEGYQLGTIGPHAAEDSKAPPEVWIELLPRADRIKRCSCCHEPVAAVHDCQERWVRDLPMLGRVVWLLVWRCRVACPRCGPKLEELSWLASYSRVTARLAWEVARLCRWLPVAHVAEYMDLHRHTVKAIDKARLYQTLGPPDLSNVEVIALDEFSIHKGHRYATVIIDPRCKRVLWICLGRSRAEIRPFFEALGEKGRQKLRAAVMDMNGAYEQEVRAQCPNARIVYDLFHIAANYSRRVIDEVRQAEAARLNRNKEGRRIIKGARWLLLRNRENLRETQAVQLHELLAANQALAIVYVLKEDLKQLWQHDCYPTALRFWTQWHRRAMTSGVEPLRKFAHFMEGKLDGILSHCQFPFHTSLLEGINNKIKVIKRMAYGYRDHEYFFLKIRAAFPGIVP
jgi:transposase